MEQMSLLSETRQQRRHRVRMYIEQSACPVRHFPITMYHEIVNAKLFFQVKLTEARPVRDGFYGIISEMRTGNYRGVAWYETKTGIWWDVGALKPIEGWTITSWYGLTAELGGRRRRKLMHVD